MSVTGCGWVYKMGKPIDETTNWVNGLVIIENSQTKNYNFVLTLDLLIKQSNENNPTSLPRKNVFVKCRKPSTFWNYILVQVTGELKLEKVQIC